MNEIWAIYGTDVPLSLVLNIGGVIPGDDDVQRVAKIFSWGFNTQINYDRNALLMVRSLTVTKRVTNTSRQPESFFADDAEQIGAKDEDFSIRTTWFGSIVPKDVHARVKEREERMIDDIKLKLSQTYSNADPTYSRLGLSEAPPGSSLETFIPYKTGLNATTQYMSGDGVPSSIDQIVKRLSEITPGR